MSICPHAQTSPHEIIQAAKTYCRIQRLRLTKRREHVLRLVAQNQNATKAYDVLETMTEPGAKVMPPVVYRALDFWMQHGFIHRIESLNAYVACGHPLNNHGCQLLVCTECGKTVEVCDAHLRKQLAKTATKSGFEFRNVVLEIQGLCPRCRPRQTPSRKAGTAPTNPAG